MIAADAPAPGVMVPEEETRRAFLGLASLESVPADAAEPAAMLEASTLPTGALAARRSAAGRSIGFSMGAAAFLTMARD